MTPKTHLGVPFIAFGHITVAGFVINGLRGIRSILAQYKGIFKPIRGCNTRTDEWSGGMSGQSKLLPGTEVYQTSLYLLQSG